MKEFDFDELDKAVNSLMGSMPSAKTTPKQDTDVQTVTLPDTTEASEGILPSHEFESHNTTSIDDSPISPPQVVDSSRNDRPAESSSSIAPRRSGRFMDMVHASGDPTKVQKAPSERPSRIGRTVAPSGGAPIVDVIKPASSDDSVEMKNSEIASKLVVDETTQDTPDIDDGFRINEELLNLEDQVNESKTNETPVVDEDLSTVETVAPEASADTSDQPEKTSSDDVLAAELKLDSVPAEPVASPFLPDAKVDKRPLGGENSSANEATVNPSGDTPAVPVPEELRSDLMAIEAGENEPATAASSVESAPKSEAAQPTAATKPEALLESGLTSIPRQYQEAPSSGDQTNGAIYDTASYHQPLAHPAKKRSSIGIIIAIIVIVLLGAGAGAFAYMNSL